MQSIILDSVHKLFRCGGFFFFRHKQIETHALKAVSFDVSHGEVLALLGPNGSGKTTALKLISTMLLPDEGRVYVKGADTRRHAQLVRRSVGFAVAFERSFYPRLTARENLDFFAALDDVPRRERPARLAEVLGHVGLEHAADKQVMKFSSGMYQRLGIARALVKRPSVLLLDEPTRSLDPAGAQSLWQLVREFARTGTAVLIATHNFIEAVEVADRVAVLQRGEVVAIRRTAGTNTEQLRRFYLRITGEPEYWPTEVPA